MSEVFADTFYWIALAMDLFKTRMDKAWSFTDCISFEIMRNRNIARALSADHHFRQAGFQTVFSSADA